MKKLQVQAFFDNTLGHEKQTRAILNSLNSLTPINISESHVGRRSLASILRFILAKLCRGLRHPSMGYNAPDIVVGTGSRCHLPMLIAAHQFPEAKVITCMTPEKLLINLFDLCLVPIHDRVKSSPKIFRTIGPPCPGKDRHEHNSEKGLILIGGIDNKSHYWNTGEIVTMIDKIISRHAISWTITSSPRTPAETLKALDIFCADNEFAEFFRSEETPNGWVEKQYDNSSVAWVTADSISMVYEALSAGSRVGILPVKWKKQGNKFQRSLAVLYKKKLATCYDDWLRGEPISEISTPLNEADRCAREILRRWWPEKLR